MEHIVFFPGPDGAPAFRRLPALDDAVRFVEHLRNVEGVAEVAVHPLAAEVPLAFRPYYRVEVPAAEAQAVVEPHVEPAPVVEQVHVAQLADAAPPVAEVPEQHPAPQLETAELELAAVSDEPASERRSPSPESIGFFA